MAAAPQNDPVRTQRLLEATALLNSTLNLPELTEIILKIAREDLGVDRATAFVVDRERQVLRSLVAQDVDRGIELPIGQGLAGTVAANGQIVDIPDAYADDRFNPDFDRALGYRTHDVLCIPVRNREGEVSGVVQLLNRSRPLSEDDRRFLDGLAVHIGLALENAWAHQQILEKRRLEEELAAARSVIAEADKMALAGELVSGIVHEIRNPLTILLGNAAMLRTQPGMDNETSAGMCDAIERSGKKTLELTQNFLNYVRVGGDEHQPVDVNAVIGQTLDLMAYEWKRHRIEVKTAPGDVPSILADPGQIQQVLMNLLRNARDAVEAIGNERRITVTSTFDAADQKVRITLTDNGPGIDPATQERIWDAFFTTKARNRGTGLGLSIVRRIVEDIHGGKIRLTSAPGEGTTFHIELPRRRSSPTTP